MENKYVLKIAVFAIFAFSYLNANAQCLSAWEYATPIEINNSDSTALYTFQVKVVLNTKALYDDGKLKSNGEDLRFTDSGSCTLLPYWIETGNVSTSENTIIWVKANEIPSNSSHTIIVYYGNPSATAASDGDSTFDLFDDFNGNSLNTSKWNKYGPGSGLASVSSGSLTLRTLAPSDVIIRSNSTVPGPITAEANITSVTGSYPSLAILSSNGFSGYTMYANGTTSISLVPANGGCSSYGKGNGITKSSPGTVVGIWGLQWPESNKQACYWPGGSLSSTATEKTISTDVNVALGGLCSGRQTMVVDWVRVRRYAKTEPGTKLGKEIKNNLKILTASLPAEKVCTGTSIKVPFTVIGNFETGNIFTAQLSDTLGSFASPVAIGTFSGNASDTVTCTLPLNIHGNNFKIRIISSSPVVAGTASTTSLSVSQLPDANAGGPDKAICIGESTEIGTKAIEGNTYSWMSIPSGFASTLASPTVSPAETTTYILTVKNASGCINTDTITISVNTLPVADAGLDKIISQGSFTTIGTNAVEGNTYSWTSLPAGFTSTDAIPTIIPSTSITYIVRVKNASGCVSYDTVEIMVVPLPDANAGKNKTICIGESAEIGAAAIEGNTYSWTSDPAGFSSTSAHPQIQPTATTTYTLTEKNAYGFSNSNSVTITVSQLPAANAGQAQTICRGTSATIGAAAIEGNTYSWTSEPSGFSSTNANPQVQPAVTTTYTLTEKNASGCVNTGSVKIIVNAVPEANAGEDQTFYYGYDDNVTLKGTTTTSGVSYKWSTGETTQNISVSPSATTTYWLTVSKDGCTSLKDEVKVTVTDVLCHDEEDYKGKDKDMDKIEICHGGNRICVSKSAAATHIKHGDAFGDCGNYPGKKSKGKRDFGSDENTDESMESALLPEKFNVYPNPFTATATIELVFAKTQNVVIDAISMDGKVAKILFSGNAESNTSYRFMLDGADMNSGVYLIRVITGEHLEYRKINFIKN